MPTPTQTEKWAELCFEQMNMMVHRARNSTVKRGKIFISQTNDIFGVFDIFAMDPVTGQINLYQVTSSRKAAPQRRRKIEDFVAVHYFHDDAFVKIRMGMLIYGTQRSRIDARKVDRFFYREDYDNEWHKQEPLYIPKEAK